MDRLSREPIMTALETVGSLLKRDITIETLSPPDTFTTKSVNDGGIWRLVAFMQMALAESEKKAERVGAAWAAKRRNATEKILTGRAPAWLRVKDRRFHVIPEAADTVQLIYRLKRDGLGKGRIERKLNAEAPWKPDGGWRASYVEKILRSRAVIGEYQPHKLDEKGKRVPIGEPIAGYFPAVVGPGLFHAVAQRMRDNKGTGGRTGKATNVFQNLVRCGYCGGPMVLVDQGSKGGKVLVCDNGRRRTECVPYRVKYPEFEDTMLSNLAKLRPETVLPDNGEAARQAKALRESIAGCAGRVADTDARIATLMEQIETTANATMRTRYEKRIEELDALKPGLEQERTRQENALRDLERGAHSFEKWQRDLAGLRKAIAEDLETRIRLKTHLKEFIARVEVFAKGHESDVEHAIELIDEHLPELRRTKAGVTFRQYVTKRLLSADGRCYRLHLRTAKPDTNGLQIAPATSLAHRMEIRGKEVRFAGPDITKLAKEYFDGRKPGFVPKASVVV